MMYGIVRLRSRADIRHICQSHTSHPVNSKIAAFLSLAGQWLYGQEVLAISALTALLFNDTDMHYQL
jgi:hypothetical protein